MEYGLKNKVALVTASSRGLGKAVAWGLAQEGAKLVICARNKKVLEKAADDIFLGTGVSVFPLAVDLTEADQIDWLVEETRDLFGKIDILVTNAGGPPPGGFNDLKENDLLFIDSSHILKIGSDVQYEYLELLPRLNSGVIIHCHDIFIPSEYPKNWVRKEHRFWNEQYLLQAFLSFNDKFEILWAGSYMHLKNPDILKNNLSTYNNFSWPISIYLRRK